MIGLESWPCEDPPYSTTGQTRFARFTGVRCSDIGSAFEREPSWETVLLITAVRRHYFLNVQKGRVSTRVWRRALVPGKRAQLGGISWLPRIIAKARAKLRGQMPVDLLYCCGGDRPFLRRVGIHPADFLLLVWEAGDNDHRIVDEIRRALAARKRVSLHPFVPRRRSPWKAMSSTVSETEPG